MDMLDPRFGAYLVVATLLIVTPGPDTALVIKNALGSGWRASSMTALGIALGSLVWGLAAVLGLAVLLEKSVTALTIFKLAGAAYLLYLGIRTIAGTLRRGPKEMAGQPRETVNRVDHAIALRQGLINNLLNPKAGAIFATALPQFVSWSDSPVRLVLMMAAYETILLVWLNLYGYVVSRARQSRMGRGLSRALERLMGAVLIALGARLAFERQ
jgi:threonine/homoserine/homoserine lactone efflux protein